MANGIVDSIQAKAHEVATEDFDRAKTLVNKAAKSGAYLYPIKGIAYFLTHSSLRKPLLSKLASLMTLSVGVFTGMFFFTYLPQLGIMVFLNGPLAVFTTILLVFNESSVIISMVSKNFMLQDALLDTFDGTLIAKNQTEILGEGRELKAGQDPMQRLGKILKNPFSRFSVKSAVRYFMYLPLNFIPVVGTVAFIFLQGRSRGNVCHDRYFQLKRWSAKQKSQWLSEHTGPYTSFGLVATLLEMVPVASVLFSFTNTVGAALWAADIEAKETQMTKSTAPDLREAASKAE